MVRLLLVPALATLAGCATPPVRGHDYASAPPVVSTDPRWDTPASRSMGIVLDPQAPQHP
jgi:hypothetical protein